MNKNINNNDKNDDKPLIKKPKRDTTPNNIRSKLATDPDFIDYFNSTVFEDIDNKSNIPEYIIEKHGCCIIPKDVKSYLKYQRTIIKTRFRVKYNIKQNWLSNHRVAYKIRYPSKDLKGLTVDHFACSNPLCSNPNHLRLATYSENTKERFEREENHLKLILKELKENNDFNKWLKIIKKEAVNFDYSGDYKTRVDEDLFKDLI
ncbi:HNH endonuclease [Pseudoalteromonas sp. JC3]|uniref:HNH endonuclease n=1 Tax=Pseudoalteromonas sp. JC3 TaxID=2810196 RepID=UPI0019D0056B|nr:HNH endonuclease [Pseudoalteromonas sp. JC3]MBR8841680.1 HNH endonuclease [Pseudoalteromonas sp. JC3]WJE07705.1 HNH endonuclease [Pseudoalteromonas sp. JC3]